MDRTIVESCSAMCAPSFSGAEYPCSSKQFRMAGMSLVVMKASSFLPLSVAGGTGGWNAWWRRLIARTSPAAPRMYLPLGESLLVAPPRVEYW